MLSVSTAKGEPSSKLSDSLQEEENSIQDCESKIVKNNLPKLLPPKELFQLKAKQGINFGEQQVMYSFDSAIMDLQTELVKLKYLKAEDIQIGIAYTRMSITLQCNFFEASNRVQQTLKEKSIGLNLKLNGKIGIGLSMASTKFQNSAEQRALAGVFCVDGFLFIPMTFGLGQQSWLENQSHIRKLFETYFYASLEGCKNLHAKQGQQTCDPNQGESGKKEASLSSCFGLVKGTPESFILTHTQNETEKLQTHLQELIRFDSLQESTSIHNFPDFVFNYLADFPHILQEFFKRQKVDFDHTSECIPILTNAANEICKQKQVDNIFRDWIFEAFPDLTPRLQINIKICLINFLGDLERKFKTNARESALIMCKKSKVEDDSVLPF